MDKQKNIYTSQLESLNGFIKNHVDNMARMSEDNTLNISILNNAVALFNNLCAFSSNSENNVDITDIMPQNGTISEIKEEIASKWFCPVKIENIITKAYNDILFDHTVNMEETMTECQNRVKEMTDGRVLFRFLIDKRCILRLNFHETKELRAIHQNRWSGIIKVDKIADELEKAFFGNNAENKTTEVSENNTEKKNRQETIKELFWVYQREISKLLTAAKFVDIKDVNDQVRALTVDLLTSICEEHNLSSKETESICNMFDSPHAVPKFYGGRFNRYIFNMGIIEQVRAARQSNKKWNGYVKIMDIAAVCEKTYNWFVEQYKANKNMDKDSDTELVYQKREFKHKQSGTRNSYDSIRNKKYAVRFRRLKSKKMYPLFVGKEFAKEMIERQLTHVKFIPGSHGNNYMVFSYEETPTRAPKMSTNISRLRNHYPGRDNSFNISGDKFQENMLKYMGIALSADETKTVDFEIDYDREKEVRIKFVK